VEKKDSPQSPLKNNLQKELDHEIKRVENFVSALKAFHRAKKFLFSNMKKPRELPKITNEFQASREIPNKGPHTDC